MKTQQRFLLPPSGDLGAELQRLFVEHSNGDPTAVGWIEDVLPGEPGWVEQPGNNNKRRRVYVATISSTQD